MVPPWAPSFMWSRVEPFVRYGESAVSPTRAERE